LGAFRFPYDGKSIGEFQNDRIRNILGHVNSAGVVSLQDAWGALYNYNESSEIAAAQTSLKVPMSLGLDVGRFVPTGPDNAPASISVSVYISY
jgi:hypothetical protein